MILYFDYSTGTDPLVHIEGIPESLLGGDCDGRVEGEDNRPVGQGPSGRPGPLTVVIPVGRAVVVGVVGVRTTAGPV